jgi:ribonuclease VapC
LAHASPKGLFDTPSVGDCFAYALAKERDLPLLFKGADFAQTDVTPALS